MARLLSRRSVITGLAALMLLPLAARIAAADQAFPMNRQTKPAPSSTRRSLITMSEEENQVRSVFTVLPDHQPRMWRRIGFNVRFDDSKISSKAVAVICDQQIIGYVGTGTYYKAVGGSFATEFSTDVEQGICPFAVADLFTETFSPPDNAWHHFDFVRDGSTVVILRDGKVVDICDIKPLDLPEVKQSPIALAMNPVLQQAKMQFKDIQTESPAVIYYGNSDIAQFAPASHADQSSSL